jgi:hypothetical protein
MPYHCPLPQPPAPPQGLLPPNRQHISIPQGAQLSSPARSPVARGACRRPAAACAGQRRQQCAGFNARLRGAPGLPSMDANTKAPAPPTPLHPAHIPLPSLPPTAHSHYTCTHPTPTPFTPPRRPHPRKQRTLTRTTPPRRRTAAHSRPRGLAVARYLARCGSHTLAREASLWLILVRNLAPCGLIGRSGLWLTLARGDTSHTECSRTSPSPRPARRVGRECLGVRRAGGQGRKVVVGAGQGRKVSESSTWGTGQGRVGEGAERGGWRSEKEG